jgi:hypothetical protein
VAGHARGILAHTVYGVTTELTLNFVEKLMANRRYALVE